MQINRLKNPSCQNARYFQFILETWPQLNKFERAAIHGLFRSPISKRPVKSRTQQISEIFNFISVFPAQARERIRIARPILEAAQDRAKLEELVPKKKSTKPTGNRKYK